MGLLVEAVLSHTLLLREPTLADGAEINLGRLLRSASDQPFQTQADRYEPNEAIAIQPGFKTCARPSLFTGRFGVPLHVPDWAPVTTALLALIR